MKYKITIGLLLLILTCQLRAQDMNRMNRDIEVAENILNSILDNEKGDALGSNVFFGRSAGVEGSYLEGFGVLFTISSRHLLGAITMGRGSYHYDLREEGIAITIPEQIITDKKGAAFPGGDSLSTLRSFKEAVHEFGKDYAFLLRQLPAQEKIMIRYNTNRSRFPALVGSGDGVISWSNSGRKSADTYAAVMLKSDVDAFQNGRISEQQFLERIKFTVESDGSEKTDRDLNLLTGIFSRLYREDLNESEIFRLNGTPEYEKIEGVGAMIDLRFGARYEPLLAVYEGFRRGSTSPVIIKGDKDRKEEIEKMADQMEATYPEFLAGLKENMVEYGSIVKDLGQNEALIFRVKFFDCEECEVIPESLEITALQATLDGYRKGKISLESAVAQLKVSHPD